MTTPRYEVIEDNAGGLYLYVYDSAGTVVYTHSGYEYRVGVLSDDIAALRAGTPPVADWDGGDDDPQAARDEWRRWDEGSDYCVVADETTVYPDAMGAAAKIEFREHPRG
ncbi:hypothetical protein LCGC14_1150640 [marine sediment metagenome]|uniref:Uncharacterized protein n=1 Tax=marine sediment metagenome TaxID=412755 RepID=A0A0F9Q162_9ZZZZ